VDNTELLKRPFTRASLFELPAESVNLQAGARLNVFDTFIDLFYGYKSIKDNIYLDSVASTILQHGYVFSYSNNDLDYSCAGISVETLKLKNIKVKFDYEYFNIIKQSSATTYLPYNMLEAKVIYQPAEWEFTLAGTLKSAQRGAGGAIAPAYADLDFSAARKITENFTLSGYVNNVLNNNYYLLYYYQEKGINLGITAVLKF
jgi:outer membrane receptor protein involved in Fe transport